MNRTTRCARGDIEVEVCGSSQEALAIGIEEVAVARCVRVDALGERIRCLDLELADGKAAQGRMATDLSLPRPARTRSPADRTEEDRVVEEHLRVVAPGKQEAGVLVDLAELALDADAVSREGAAGNGGLDEAETGSHGGVGLTP